MFTRIQKTYNATAIVLLNTIILVIVLNAGLLILNWAGVISLHKSERIDESVVLPVSQLGSLTYGMDTLRQIHYTMTEEEITWLLLENANLPLVCDDRAIFRQGPFNGRYFHIDDVGFRWNAERPPWPPDEDKFNIFMFGGSTMLGDAVPDAGTIPAHLQELLNKEQYTVYNFGHGFYFSLQERLFFEKLIDQGHIPDAVIFIDGLNEFYLYAGEPYNDQACTEPVTTSEQIRSALRCDYGELCLPMQRLNAAFTEDEEFEFNPAPYPPRDSVEANREIIERWLENKRKIEGLAEQHDIQTLFIMQPVPTYAFDLAYHPIETDLYNFGLFNRHHWAYELWEAMYNDPDSQWSSNVLNLSHLAEDRTEDVWVDLIHYTAGFSEVIARAIRDELIQREWVSP